MGGEFEEGQVISERGLIVGGQYHVVGYFSRLDGYPDKPKISGGPLFFPNGLVEIVGEMFITMRKGDEAVIGVVVEVVTPPGFHGEPTYTDLSEGTKLFVPYKAITFDWIKAQQ